MHGLWLATVSSRSAAHRGHGGDGDSECGLTWARAATMVGRGDRVEGRDIAMSDWTMVLWWQRASVAKFMAAMATVAGEREGERGMDGAATLPHP